MTSVNVFHVKGTSGQKPVVLIVDDTPDNLQVLSQILRHRYRVKAATNGLKALEIAQGAQRPDIILLDVVMPEMDGYQVCQALKANPLTANIPVIFVSAMEAVEDERKGLKVGAVDYITKPVSPPIVEARIENHLALSNQARLLEQRVAERTRELEQTRLQIIRRLGRAAEFKDNETGLHVIRMSHYSRQLAEQINKDNSWVELLFNAAPMHDIGKIGIPDSILTKPGKLNEDEWRIMRQHPKFGAQIIGDSSAPIMNMAQKIALCHHEKWDGSGYPNGLEGKQIPLEARIVAVADVFDALTTERPYKKAWSVEKALQLIADQTGKHFDPMLVDIFHQILPNVLQIKEQYGEHQAEQLLSA